MSDAQMETLRWFRTLVSEYVAALEPSQDRDGALFLSWSSGDVEHMASFEPDGSIWMQAQQLWDGGDEAFEKIETPNVKGEQMVRDFYKWW